MKSVLDQLKIYLNYEEIKELKKSEFKKIVRNKVENIAFFTVNWKTKACNKGK